MSQDERYEEKMRRNRLIFYENDVERIDEVMGKFLEASQARCILLIDLEGHMVSKQGFTDRLDTTSIAALVAGSFASTREVARKLGETEFSVLFHQGSNENIHITLVADRALAVIIFDDRTTIGMVRLYAKQVMEDLSELLNEIAEKQAAGGDPDAPKLTRDYTDAAEAQLDDFFGDDSQ